MAVKLYLPTNVFDAALERMRWIFDEFERVTVCFSGGKDSTVILNLALMVAEEKGRLPVKVLFVDQEAEWRTVVDYIREVMADPRVEPQWLQVPIKLFNATSVSDPWLYCWEPGAIWMRNKEPVSIKENVYGTDRFKDMFQAVTRHDHPNEPAVRLGGLKAAESPARLRLLTSEVYKGVTWGKKEDERRGHFLFYPIYDWADQDVWTAIHRNLWPYCPIYDAMYQHGVAFSKMRVSNLHHETAVHHLFYLQEIEGDTWNKLTERLSGVNTAGKLKSEMFIPKKLPFMFRDWREYRDHLLANLIPDPVIRKRFESAFARQERDFDNQPHMARALARNQVAQILTNDFELTKYGTFYATHVVAKNAGSRDGTLGGFRDRVSA